MKFLKNIRQGSGINPTLFVLVLIHLFLLANLMFTAWPEMVAWPYLILNGWLPYRDIAIAHTPLLIVDLAIFNKIFGLGLLQLKIYTWILILLTDLLLFYVAKKLWNTKIALLAIIFYIPLQILYEGNGLWFDLALAPLILLTYYNLKKPNYLWSGVFLGLAFFTKQTAFWLLIPIAIYFFRDFRSKTLDKLMAFSEGFLAIMASVFIVISLFIILPDFIRWTINFGVFYLPRAEGQILIPALKQFIISIFPFIILTPLIFWKKIKNSDLVIWTVFSGMGIYPRFELFHFQPALPFLAMGAGISVFYIIKNPKVVLKLTLLGYLAVLIFLSARLVIRDWGKEARFYGQNEANISSVVKASVDAGEKIYVLNYWDSIYAMTDTLPATKPLVPYLPWYLEFNNLKEGIVRDLIVDMPEIIVAGNYSDAGLGSYSVGNIDELIQKYYTLSYKKGDVNIYSLNR